jgi:hypothetical protein
MDISAINGFLMTIHGHEDQDFTYRGHRKYQETLAMELLTTPDDRPQQMAEAVQTSPPAREQWRVLPRQAYCKWCNEHKEEAMPKAKRRKVLAELPNGVNRRPRAFVPQTWAACNCHGTPLCRKGDCWTLYHCQLAQNGSTLP